MSDSAARVRRFVRENRVLLTLLAAGLLLRLAVALPGLCGDAETCFSRPDTPGYLGPARALAAEGSYLDCPGGEPELRAGAGLPVLRVAGVPAVRAGERGGAGRDAAAGRGADSAGGLLGRNRLVRPADGAVGLRLHGAEPDHDRPGADAALRHAVRTGRRAHVRLFRKVPPEKRSALVRPDAVPGRSRGPDPARSTRSGCCRRSS